MLNLQSKYYSLSIKIPISFVDDEYRFVIEYDGEQYFNSVEYFGGEDYFKIPTERDKIKNQKCLDNNYKLFRVKFGYSETDLEELISNIKSYIVDSSNYIPKLREGSKITII